MSKVVISLYIDQELEDDEIDAVVNEYVDELARTNGRLSWSEVDWEVLPA